eukprot:CAMPEP_0172170150 /NCGR_PEP_ID=MMETSP1050-20130122/11103_1 /TAXON_ID=233186 /ORGANISM="Cryptomonas curvata, Strain CCAP979/52" /LENGTH=72 /DNA_ID=CAMNT_0012841291 /DNA_START=263 /DNA_END=481 /DNA_ORIENTATION=+
MVMAVVECNESVRPVGMQLTQAYPWGASSGNDYGDAGGTFDGDGTGPNLTADDNHPYSARREYGFGSLAAFR